MNANLAIDRPCLHYNCCSHNKPYEDLKLFILDTYKQGLWQTVKTQMSLHC